MKTLSLVLPLLLSAPVASQAAQNNVLVIIADDLGANNVESYREDYRQPYRGRLPVCEWLTVTAALRDAASQDPAKLQALAAGAGLQAFGLDAFGRLAGGETSLAEVQQLY